MCVCVCSGKVHRLNGSYDSVIFNDVMLMTFYQSDPMCSAALIEVSGPQGRLCYSVPINLFHSVSINLSHYLSIYLYIYIHIYIYIYI